MRALKLVRALVVVGLGAAAAPLTGELVLRVPWMPEQRLLKKVDPEYPAAALQRRIQGTVRFNALLAKDGHIERLRLVSGHRLLVRAAEEAARQWVYRPTLVGGKPVRVITLIDVHFRLDRFGRPVKPRTRSSATTTA